MFTQAIARKPANNFAQGLTATISAKPPQYDKIVVDEADAYAANTLLVNGYLLTPAGFPDSRKQLEVLGFKIIELETSEVHKMDGGLTCMSIRF